jgi:membrane protease YdiL (CAAX protease family)
VIQVGYAAAGLVLLLVVPIDPPPARLAQLPAVALGLSTGSLLALALARGPTGRRLALLVPAVAAGLGEEAVWRWGVLAGSAPRFGWGGALALSAFGFAYRHTRSERLPTYLLLGAAFGGVFLATGRLLAAVAAHSAYNGVVCLRTGP